MPADVVLRPAVAGDAAACAAIVNAWIDATDWMPRIHPPADVLRFFREVVLPTRVVTVAERDAVLVGVIAVADGHVYALYVADGARRRRVGSALLDAAKAANPAGLTLWTFVVNREARAFYAARGFAELRQTDGDNEEGLPDILLAWPGAL